MLANPGSNAPADVEYRLGVGAWARYSAAVTVPAGTVLTYRAVDVNGNVEATKTVTA